MFSGGVRAWLMPIGIAALIAIVIMAGAVFFGLGQVEEIRNIIDEQASLITPEPVVPDYPTPPPQADRSRPALPDDSPSPGSSVIQPGVFVADTPTPAATPGPPPESRPARNALPGDDTNIYGQRKFRDIDDLIERSEVIVSGVLDYNRAPDSVLYPIYEDLFRLDRDHGPFRMDTQGRYHMLAPKYILEPTPEDTARIRQLSQLLDEDFLLDLPYELAPDKVNSGLWIPPAFEWVFGNNFNPDNHLLAHKGLFTEGLDMGGF